VSEEIYSPYDGWEAKERDGKRFPISSSRLNT
jgi:hypothetical protein